METTTSQEGIDWGYIEVMENTMETTGIEVSVCAISAIRVSSRDPTIYNSRGLLHARLPQHAALLQLKASTRRIAL